MEQPPNAVCIQFTFIFEFYPKPKRGVKSKNIKAQPMCKFAQLYASHELFLKFTQEGGLG
jgi:hypothetical protein